MPPRRTPAPAPPPAPEDATPRVATGPHLRIPRADRPPPSDPALARVARGRPRDTSGMRITAEQAASRHPAFPSRDGRAFAVWAVGHAGARLGERRTAREWSLLIDTFLARAI